jgi:hypothetical protein
MSSDRGDRGHPMNSSTPPVVPVGAESSNDAAGETAGRVLLSPAELAAVVGKLQSFTHWAPSLLNSFQLANSQTLRVCSGWHLGSI